jgi:hypothetical protein
MRVACLFACAMTSCYSPSPATVEAPAPRSAPGPIVANGVTPDGKLLRIDIDGDTISKVSDGDRKTTWLWPPIIDSHVHLALFPVAHALAARGVGGAVDLASPERTMAGESEIQLIRSGPMITKPGGYPLDSWGADGYGIACDSETCVREAIDRLHNAGAKVIKLPLGSIGLPGLLPRKATEYAHKLGMKVVVHAMQSDAPGRPVTLASGIGADVLAHMPIEPLDDFSIAHWSKPGRAVITTLAAFGGSDIAVDNLRKLHAAGATILYGTDLGNLRDEGPSAAEISLMKKAGMDDAAIVASMTTVPINFWGFDFAFAPGKEATFFVLDADPRLDVNVLLKPSSFISHGQRPTSSRAASTPHP